MFYLILFFAILVLYLSFPQQKEKALIFSMILLFIPWGLQFEMVQDWTANYSRWHIVNNLNQTAQYGNREIEVGYVWLLRFAKPLGFFGYLMACAIIELCIIGIFIQRYVRPQFYWLAIMVLMLNPNYGMLIINSNRQSVTLTLTLIAVFIIFESKRISFLKKNPQYVIYILTTILIGISTQIHSGSYSAFVLLAIFILARYYKGEKSSWMFIVCNLLYFGRYFIDSSHWQTLVSSQWTFLGVEGFDSYIEELDNSIRKYSIVEQFIWIFFMNSAIYFYKKMDLPQRFFMLCLIIGFLGDGYLIRTIARILIYFNIFTIFAIPEIIRQWSRVKNQRIKEFSKFIFIVSIAYLFFMFYKSQTKGVYYERWADFQTVFSAPLWL